MSVQYVRLKNRCSERITLRPHFAMPQKGRAHVPKPIVLAPNQVSKTVLLSAVVDCHGWQDCISAENVSVPAYIQVEATKKKPVSLQLKLKRKAKGRVHIRTIRISRKPRIIRLDTLAKKSEVKKLQRKKLLKVKSYAPLYLGTGNDSGNGYGDFYACRDCGRPIVFRGSPPKPIHI